MKEKLRAYPMVILLLPLVAAILLFIDPPPKYPPRTAPNALQERLYGRLASAGLEGDELATVGALTLGYKEALRKELRQHFQVSGAAHVLAVSGLHTGILYGVIVWLLTLGCRFRPMHENRIGRRTLSPNGEIDGANGYREILHEKEVQRHASQAEANASGAAQITSAEAERKEKA